MEQQPTTMPEMNRDLVDKSIEMIFEMAKPDGRCVLEWCRGIIIDVSNGN